MPVRWIIPAYAGSTQQKRLTGETVTGSSPHTRGAQHLFNLWYGASWDHPRIRGEHAVAPHVHAQLVGIIPAYAGSTAVWYAENGFGVGSSPHTRGAPVVRPVAPVAHRDHPRIRGEHALTTLPLSFIFGIIPAYAGSTFGLRNSEDLRRGSSPHTRGAPRHDVRATRRQGDHPRIRGEHLAPLRAARVAAGIIPAYAGSTSAFDGSLSGCEGSSPHTRGAPTHCSSGARERRDHPRIRGEHACVCRLRQGFSGIIPAYAGSTAIIGAVGMVMTGSSPHTRGAHLRHRIRRG